MVTPPEPELGNLGIEELKAIPKFQNLAPCTLYLAPFLITYSLLARLSRGAGVFVIEDSGASVLINT